MSFARLPTGRSVQPVRPMLRRVLLLTVLTTPIFLTGSLFYRVNITDTMFYGWPWAFFEQTHNPLGERIHRVRWPETANTVGFFTCASAAFAVIFVFAGGRNVNKK